MKRKIVYAFIDSQNLNLGVRSQGWIMDWRKLRQYLRNRKKLLKVLVPTERYSALLREFNKENYVIRIDLLKKSLEKKETGICGRSKP